MPESYNMSNNYMSGDYNSAADDVNSVSYYNMQMSKSHVSKCNNTKTTKHASIHKSHMSTGYTTTTLHHAGSRFESS